jgi:hypothetical protein
MLETVVISVAAVAGLVILGLMFYAARQADLNLGRRVQDANAGGRPLSLDERAAVRVRGVRPIPPDENVGGWYARYRRRNALTGFHARIGVLLLSYLVVFALAVGLLGFPLGFIAMYVLGLVAIVGLHLLRRNTPTDEQP